MLSLDNNAESADELQNMANAVMRNYVTKHHTRAINHLVNAKGNKKGMWKTYVYEGGKRKEICKKTEDDLYDALYKFYQHGTMHPVTFKEMFDQLMEHKQNHLGRAEQTIYQNQRHFSGISPELQNMALDDISEEDIQQWLVEDFLPKKPKEEMLRKVFQLLSQVFAYGIRKRIRTDNPMDYLSVQDYLKYCDHSKKTDEERSFSEEEIDLIHDEVCKTLNNPRSLMVLTAMETGLRSGELAALHKTDVVGDYLHIHRQQRRTSQEGRTGIEELQYTKDERMHPHDGRKVPMTRECKEAVNLALNLPGKSEYLFHNADGSPIAKDSYNRYLARVCGRLGITTTNNHAFRLAFNTRMIDLGFSSAERALILGHAVQTNETHYSVSDKRRLDHLKESIVNSRETR